MAINPFYRCMGFIASILGILQGITWFIMALMAILIYTKAWIPTSNESTYGQVLSTTIVARFLSGGHPRLVYVGPLQLFSCSIAYLIASVFWTILSTYLFWVVFRGKPLRLRKAFVAWAGWTIILCIYDLVFTSLLAHDYDQVVQEINQKENPTTKDYIVILAYGVIMTLVARGFVLWIVNITVAIYIFKLAFTVPKEVTEEDINSDTINAFDTTKRDWTGNKPELARNNSFISSRSFGTFQGLPRLPPVQSTNETLTRLSRTVTRSPSNISPTRSGTFLYPDSVSSPEYTIPKSPVVPMPPLRPVLKNRFQNSYS